jgi:translation initiation factor IF-3
MAHQEFGHRLIERVKNDLAEHGVVEQYPKMEGRQLVMVLGPKKVVVKKKTEPEKKAEPAAK